MTRSKYLTVLVELYPFLKKIRTDGLLEVADQLAHPEGSFLTRHPILSQTPYQEFTRELLQFMADGSLELPELECYAKTGIRALSRSKWYQRKPDLALLELIWVVLRATAAGHPPLVACEFGRQALPVGHRISPQQLNEALPMQSGPTALRILHSF